ncbi:MAG: oxidase [Acidobacteria bacterium]|nr:MAG: oxidase [Acidobacteriota bacterium]
MSEHEHHSLWKPYGQVLVALLVLTVVTVVAANFHFGTPWSDLVALFIALSKAALVVAFFMHVKGSTRLIKFAVWTGVIGIAIFFALTLSDYATRVITYVDAPRM